jgi:hypothetical protein
MATLKSNNPVAVEQAEIAEYGDWSCRVSYDLNNAAYLARAARALLREHPSVDSDEGLTGVSFLLSRLVNECEELALEVGNTQFLYVQKRDAKEASHA